jgi:integrase
VVAGQRVAAGIYKAGVGVYDVHVSTGKGPNGKYRKVTKRVRGTLAVAKDERVRMLGEVATGLLKPADTLTMTQLHERFMATRTIAQATRDNYDYYWSKLKEHIGTTTIKGLRAVDLDHAYAAIATGVGSNTTRKCAKHASALLNQAMRWDLIGRNVANSATPPREVPFNTTPPTDEQRVALVDAAFEQEPQFGALVHLAATTGARRGELAGLRWGDLVLKTAKVRIVHQPNSDGTLRQTKNGWQRVIGIDADTVGMLERHRAYCGAIAAECEATVTDGCFVFSPEPGNRLPFRVDGLTSRWSRLRKTTGIKCRLHDLRHAQATTLLAQGISPVVGAERLGQTVEVFIATYGHSDSAQNERAAIAGGLRR